MQVTLTWEKLARLLAARVGKNGNCEDCVCPVWVHPHGRQVHGDKLSLGFRGSNFYKDILKLEMTSC